MSQEFIARRRRACGQRPRRGGRSARPRQFLAFSRWVPSASCSATSAPARSTRCRLRSAISRAPASASLEVVGVVSLIIWALLIVVTAKYVLFLMQADNKGEGGILSLKALAQIAMGKRTMVASSCSASRARRCFPATRSSRPPFRCFRRSRASSRSTPNSRRSSCRRRWSSSLCCSRPRAAARRAWRRSSGRSWRCSSSSTPCSAPCTSPTPGSSCARSARCRASSSSMRTARSASSCSAASSSP